jgi:toxin ParE1/3/4
MGQFRISDRARTDIIDIWFYMAADSADSADRLNARFYDEFTTLSRHPLMGRSRPELAPDLRSFPVGNYVIFYRPLENGIEVMRVLSTARDIDTLFQKV